MGIEGSVVIACRRHTQQKRSAGKPVAICQVWFVSQACLVILDHPQLQLDADQSHSLSVTVAQMQCAVQLPELGAMYKVGTQWVYATV